MTKKNTTMTIDDICDCFIAKSNAEGEAMTHKKLQCLLYFAQGLSFALDGKPLFKDKIMAYPAELRHDNSRYEKSWHPYKAL